MLKRLAVIGILAGALALAPKASEAAYITGGVFVAGAGSPVGAASWYQSTGVNFTNPWHVISSSGDYASVPFGQNVTFTDISWGSGTGNVAVAFNQNVWTFTIGALTYTLDIGTVTNILRGSAQNPSIAVQGTGTLSIIGSNLSPTFGIWNFSAGTASTTANLSFSSDATAVPEPGSMLLLGTGLLGLGAIVRRRITGRA